jgi:hypothetical protein
MQESSGDLLMKNENKLGKDFKMIFRRTSEKDKIPPAHQKSEKFKGQSGIAKAFEKRFLRRF